MNISYFFLNCLQRRHSSPTIERAAVKPKDQDFSWSFLTLFSASIIFRRTTILHHQSEPL